MIGVHKGFAPPGPGTAGVKENEVEPETSINTEIGFKSNKGLNSLEFTYFRNKYENLIVQILLLQEEALIRFLMVALLIYQVLSCT